ncbi:hypothetical protein X737_22045 [Mesorhizobium sp. L48C026A00]|nr:hypothetical protein X737_22045 [Mesorhizobium sp. L48C026A00]
MVPEREYRFGWIVLKKSAMKPWIHSHRSVLIKVDATSSP